jgi:hypothetical protein
MLIIICPNLTPFLSGCDSLRVSGDKQRSIRKMLRCTDKSEGILRDHTVGIDHQGTSIEGIELIEHVASE